MTNILATGSTGFIGSHLVDHLSQNPNNKIYGLSRSIKHESTFKALNLDQRDNVNIIFGNVTDSSDFIEEVLNNYDIEQVFHLAAQPIVQKASITPISTYRTNIMGTLNVLEAIRSISTKKNKDIPTVVMSTDKVYGNSEKLPYTEKTCLNGSDIYSSSKSGEDIIARAYSYNYDMNVTVARPCNTYAEYDFNWSRIVPTLARTFLDNDNKNRQHKKLILNKGSYHYIREYLYANDTVRALESLITNIDKTKGEAYNISSEQKYATEEFVNKFIQIADKYCDISDVSIQFKDKIKTFKEIETQYLDCSKIRNVTGWQPEYSLESGLKKTIEGYYNWFARNT